tara:strand:- start:2285 stop:2965 length:681 start_codon:yes stop_codon:yes gene_type:complete
MKTEILQEIIKKKLSKKQFAVLTNLENSNSEIFELGKQLSKEFENSKSEIENYYKLKKNGIIEETQIFIQNYTKPINVVVIGAVHITQYLIDFAKNLNFEITIIDPRKYFASEKRFKNVNIINEWPDEAFKKIEANSNTALVALTHDPKIDDPALQYALKNKFFYIGALGSKKTHANRCQRLKEYGFSEEEISTIHGPIGIKLGGKSPPEIALSIISQLVSESYKV